MKKLTIDTEFYNLTVPITDQQQEQLEESLLRNGCIEPIITWDGMIIDGHKRYLICCMEAIEFETEEVEFASRMVMLPNLSKSSMMRWGSNHPILEILQIQN